MSQLMSIILAAGAGTRMKSKIPKVLHKVSGQTLVDHVVDAVEEIGCNHIVAITGHGREEVEEQLQSRGVKFALQAEQLGTGHAVQMAADHIGDDENVLILCGDTPLLEPASLKGLVDLMVEKNYSGALLTTFAQDPTGYGRILRNDKDEVVGIVEHKDATDEQRAIKEINPAVYCFKGDVLKKALGELDNNNAQGEYYLTDVIGIIRGYGHVIGGYAVEDASQMLGVNSRVQLHEAEQIMQSRILNKLMIEGVTIINANNTYIEKKVQIGRDTIIYPGSYITGTTTIGEDCHIGPDARIENTKVADRVEVRSSTLLDSCVDDDTKVGPYAYLRPKSTIGKNVKVGDFVEVKNSTIGDNSKVSHLAYIGDGDVGQNVNIGCGVVFVNYDGKNKNRTTVKDGAFVGCNANLVAPVTVSEGAYVAAGSTVTENVEEKSLAIARAKQVNKTGWVEKKNLLK
ncbi:bifunctional UDP-N-acetylglucosamine diphosphorylase/glucosamine-1-phosphate N-acetyltransferase GlmU [Fusibacter sp. JL216-2]|uniref:bifunctional UDP-N-acetylglucosamine diphosphorylase/glucosamine-1-phosphate N-acetyltransferase GlmU n=1 Tax=Fusibacter sp. JL216-2 TaxID=3071453 RepID=UPI003D351D79